MKYKIKQGNFKTKVSSELGNEGKKARKKLHKKLNKLIKKMCDKGYSVKQFEDSTYVYCNVYEETYIYLDYNILFER